MSLDRRTPRADTALDRALDPAPRAWGGEETTFVDEFSAFYRAEFRPVARTVYLIVHDAQRAEDLTQEAFLKLLQHWKKVSRYERPGAWVRRVAIRLATKQARRERLRGLLEREGPAPSGASPADVDLMRAVARLPPNQRAAVVLFYFEDRPIAEIVDLMSCSPSAAKVWLHRARQTLAELLTEEVPEDVS
jgi:RNA polymerase sigma-70 factor (ECF subfamily)